MKKQTFISDIILHGVTGREDDIFKAIQDLEGKKAKFIIQEYKKKRTDKQNKYWWSVCIPLLKTIFLRFADADMSEKLEDPEYVHKLAKEYIWEYYHDTYFMGAHTRIILPSPELDTKEWNDLMIKTQQWAAARRVIIPDPASPIPEWVPDYHGDYKL